MFVFIYIYYIWCISTLRGTHNVGLFFNLIDFLTLYIYIHTERERKRLLFPYFYFNHYYYIYFVEAVRSIKQFENATNSEIQAPLTIYIAGATFRIHKMNK